MSATVGDAYNPPQPLWEAVRRRWLQSIVVVALATALGILVAALMAPTYKAEARLAVGAGELSTVAIPGFPTASKDLAASYSRWVTLQGVGGFDTPPNVEDLSASPIPESNVIRIETTSADQQAALSAAQGAAQGLIAAVVAVKADNDPDAMMKQILAAAPAVATAEAKAQAALNAYNQFFATGRGNEDRLLTAYSRAAVAVQQLRLQQDARMDRYRRIVANRTTEADLRTIGRGAAIVGSDRNARMQRFGLVGFGAGVVLALILAAWGQRRDRSRAAAEGEPAGEPGSTGDPDTTGEHDARDRVAAADGVAAADRDWAPQRRAGVQRHGTAERDAATRP